MKFKYCPQCGALGDFSMRCPSCKAAGEPKEGTMEEMNSFRKRLKENSGGAMNDYINAAGRPMQQNSGQCKPVVNREWAEKLKKLKGTTNSECEIF